MCAEKDDELGSIVAKNFDLVSECGITKPFTKITVDDKVSIVQSVALHLVILKTLGELSQFKDGLKTLGVLNLIESQGDSLRAFFVNKKPDLTAGISHRDILMVLEAECIGLYARHNIP